jgi:serine/threonine-protein kinase
VPSVPADSLVGTVLEGRYRVVARLAEGGMATVYLGTDTRLDREVAVKVMHRHLAADESFVTRFRREARSAARLSHPAIVAVYDQGEDDGLLYLVMEYVPGHTLREVLDAEGPLTPRAALDILDPVLDGLATAHRAGIVHRDVKPENVILREDGAVKVADFGLARPVTSQTVTSSGGTVMGTVAYLSPEQVERGVADARSDVYAAGLVLFEMLTGSKAVTGDTAIAVAYQHVHGGVPAPSSRAPGTPPVLDRLVAEAAARDPDDRPPDAGALRERLRAARGALTPAELDGRPGGVLAEVAAATATTALPPPGSGPSATAALPVAPRPGPPTPPPSPPRRARARWPWVLAALSAVLAAVTAWFFLLGPGDLQTVPDVVGRTEAQARSALEASHLGARTTAAFDEKVAAGVVLAADPAPGQQARRGTDVTLTVSRGPERYAVPALAGTTVAEATSRLEQGRLALGEVTEAWSETVPQGQVVAVEPAPGTQLKRDAAVALTVSKGRQPVEVTDFRGKPAAQARAALEKAGLVVEEGERRNDDSVPKDAVLSQDPAGGTLFRGDKVTLVVSDGPVLVAVPDVVGKQVDEAQRILEAAGFRVQVERLFGGIFGTVRFQEPGAGTQAPKGSTVTIQAV